MMQLELPIISTESRRTVIPDSDGEYAVRLTGGMWDIAVYSGGKWVGYNCDLDPAWITDWCKLEVRYPPPWGDGGWVIWSARSLPTVPGFSGQGQTVYACPARSPRLCARLPRPVRRNWRCLSRGCGGWCGFLGVSFCPEWVVLL